MAIPSSPERPCAGRPGRRGIARGVPRRLPAGRCPGHRRCRSAPFPGGERAGNRRAGRRGGLGQNLARNCHFRGGCRSVFRQSGTGHTRKRRVFTTLRAWHALRTGSPLRATRARTLPNRGDAGATGAAKRFGKKSGIQPTSTGPRVYSRQARGATERAGQGRAGRAGPAPNPRSRRGPSVVRPSGTERRTAGNAASGDPWGGGGPHGAGNR